MSKLETPTLLPNLELWCQINWRGHPVHLCTKYHMGNDAKTANNCLRKCGGVGVTYYGVGGSGLQCIMGVLPVFLKMAFVHAPLSAISPASTALSEGLAAAERKVPERDKSQGS